VFPFVVGRTLNDWIEQAPPADEWTDDLRELRCRLARAVGRQIGVLAAAGIINRDYKPTNLIVDEACQYRGAEPIMIDPAVRRRRCARQVYQMLAVLVRSALAVGTVTPREAVLCLRSVLEADSSIARAQPHRLRTVARRVKAINDARLL